MHDRERHRGLELGGGDVVGERGDRRAHLAQGIGVLGGVADQASFAGRIGAGAPEGQGASALGSLWRYADSLRRVRDLLLREHTGAGWRSVLNEVLDRLVGDPAEHADALREVRAAIAALGPDLAAALPRATDDINELPDALDHDLERRPRS